MKRKRREEKRREEKRREEKRREERMNDTEGERKREEGREV